MPAKKSPKKPQKAAKKPVAKKKAAPAKKKSAATPAAKHAKKPAVKTAKAPTKKPAAKAAAKPSVKPEAVKTVSVPITKSAATPAAPAKAVAAKAAQQTAPPKKPVPTPKIIDKPQPPQDAQAEGEDGDADIGSASLLAGPRNVTPYQPKRGEQYMNKEQLEHFRTILWSWKRDLMEEVDRTVLHMKDEAANFPDPNDRATQESEFSLELRTRDRERKLIRKIDSALSRIDDGSYGYCVETGEEIGIKRLEARPVATLSVEAQERRERREKQYGDRDDRYR